MSDKKPDEFHGQGGSYVVENGKRRLVERTEETAERKREPAPATGDKPAEGSEPAGESKKGK